MRALLAIALLLTGAATSGAGKPVPRLEVDQPFPLLEVGKPFPVLKLPLAGERGASASIMDYRGRKLMLHLFASW